MRREPGGTEPYSPARETRADHHAYTWGEAELTTRFARRSGAQSLDLEILMIDLGCAFGRNLDLGEEKRMRREPGQKRTYQEMTKRGAVPCLLKLNPPARIGKQ